MPSTLTILICTHNRAALLERTLASINLATLPSEIKVKIVVAVNACTDDTVARLKKYQSEGEAGKFLELDFLEVPIAGKSHALNSALPTIEADLIALVDDDHRVDKNYLVGIESAATTWPEADFYCGRILPDWTGVEPAWVHDTGPYRIFPLPVPRFDLGDAPLSINSPDDAVPGGGNLIGRREFFTHTGMFSTTLGPQGHDLGGGEDSEYVLRAFSNGLKCKYVPKIVQHHYVDSERLQFSYLLRKSYQRTRSIARMSGAGRVPTYLWRKFLQYFVSAIFTLSWPRRRFFLMRTAATCGEIKGSMESGNRRKTVRLGIDGYAIKLSAIFLVSAFSAVFSWILGGDKKIMFILPVILIAIFFTLMLVSKSLLDFSRTGPKLSKKIRESYRKYTIFSLARLAFWVFCVLFFLGGEGAFIGYAGSVFFDSEFSQIKILFWAASSILIVSLYQFFYYLRFNPGLLITSAHYRISRFYSAWEFFTPKTLRLLSSGAVIFITVLLVVVGSKIFETRDFERFVIFTSVGLFFFGVTAGVVWTPKIKPAQRKARDKPRTPNILMIGSDTLRADRLGSAGYVRSLTPNIDSIAARGANFRNCYVPCARTAPSLVSFLTGMWPHNHGIRDNFIPDADTRLKTEALPKLLKPLGYKCFAISDWCGADFGKFSFGFDYVDVPEDQWNLKYFIRQGPKDLRLFLSLFLHNRLGRIFFPEIYYLGGVPLTKKLGARGRRLLSRIANENQPFMLNIFFSTTHPPFASEWPWYECFAKTGYVGESKFAMAKLNDPFEIIRRQGSPKEEFDLDQIVNLYDGCVAQFDDEVGKLLHHLEVTGLSNNTIVVVYSDHGMEFFEHETWGQGNSAIGEASPKVPLVIYDPRIAGVGVVDEVVRSIDVTPTLLDLVGAQIPEKLDGVTLAKGLRKETFPKLSAFNETGIWVTDIPGLPETHLRYPDLLELLDVANLDSGTLGIKDEFLDKVVLAKDRMIRDGRWKLVYQPLLKGHKLVLFDLVADPGCAVDRLSEEPEIAALLWSKLSALIFDDLKISSNLARSVQ